MKQFTELNAWIPLEKQAQDLRSKALKTPPEKRFQLHTPHISLDFTNQRLDETTFELLLELAKECNLEAKIKTLIQGDIVNHSEKRPALHTALRTHEKTLLVDGHNIMQDIVATREKMHAIATQIRAGFWLGSTGRPITHIVNIGMGGSDFGPRFCIDALSEWKCANLSYHFVSDMDPHSFEHAVAGLNPETTLFIISSKSFTTQETLYNAKKAFAFSKNCQPAKHFIAVTANSRKAEEFGIENVLPIWDWVGGRYSLCSAINLITCIAIGPLRFTELLDGAHSMDEHFKGTDFHENLPVVMALIGVWNINFLHIPSLLLLVYAKQLEQLVPYIQQLDMESNGKSIDINGRSVNYSTGPIIWGGSGNQAQHSYYQLLCQGTHKVAADFISTRAFDNEVINSLCEKKIQVLSKGIPELNANAYIAGGMPINHLQVAACTPFVLGALIALYEHKIFTQSVLWHINPFDQPGVESAKRFKKMPEVIKSF
ncbi:MAG: glucose-6-phosphate isomerase [Legionella sp.]|nr:glucose-6-phosphate isomerase [Legionella sp.]